MSKALVAYFSASGVTKAAAQRLASLAGADIFEITPAVPYTEADLNWMDKGSRSSVEMADKASRPAVSSTLANPEQYDTVFVGFPIWWYIAPTIINTFLEGYSWQGKRIILFATSGGSGFGKAMEFLKNSCPGATLTEGKLLNHASDEDISAWLKTL